MAITEENRTAINVHIDAVTDKRRTRLTILQLLDRYSRYTNQIVVDKERLIQSGYDWTIAERDIALFTVFTEVHAERIAAEGKGANSIRRKKMEKMNMYYEVLCLIVQHVFDETNDETVKAAHSKIKKGNSQADTLHDILAMAKVLKEHQDIAVTFTPRGIVANEGYLDLITQEVQSLLDQNGIPIQTSSERAYLVDRQERIITLCLEAIDRIKKYAKGTFFMDKAYYRKFYTLYDFNQKNTPSSEGDTENTTGESEMETLPEPVTE